MTEAVKTGAAVANTRPHGKIIIVGGGLSGIEVAAEIRSSRPDLRIQLMDRNEAVLRPFDMKIREYVEAWLLKNHVEVIHHSQVEAVDTDGVVNRNEKYKSDVKTRTVGHLPNRIVQAIPYEKDREGKGVINELYLVPEDEGA